MRKSFAFLLLAALFLMPFSRSYACTNFLVTKGASVTGSTMITYAADSHVLYGELYHWAAKTYPAGTMLDVYDWDSGQFLGKIKQVVQTYNVVGNMNEWQVAISETTYGGREELVDTTGIMDYGSLIYITLQRAKTAREAIKIMTDLVAEYGYYSSGESFSISDPNEVWIMEMIGKGSPAQVKDKKGKMTTKYSKGAVWVALRVPDGYVSGHANQARIQTFPLNDPENCMYAADVISFAREKGYFSGQDTDFSFSDTYAPVDFGAARGCEARVWSGFNKITSGMDKYLDYAMGKDLKNRMPLWVKPTRKLTVQDVYGMMRDYYQGTPMDMTTDIGAGPYRCIVRWRPMHWKVDGVEYLNERAISTQQTAWSFVTESRSWLPREIGGIIWWGVDDTYSTVYTPIYTSSTRVPETMARGYGSMMEFKDDAAFWVFNQVSNFSYTRYSDMIVDIQKKQKELEEGYIAQIDGIDKVAMEKYKKNPADAVEFLTHWSMQQGNNTTYEWKRFYGFLFCKYMDGNIKTPSGKQNPNIKQPGYSDEFYRTIVKETGDRYRVPVK